jgi:DNA (cytosine-5)-methyltransferase 1
MQIIDLFSGIGGFSLAGHWMGWETIQFCEIDKFCQALLKQNFPGVPIHNDIKTLKGEQIKINPDEPTILVGGFPCQPFSNAGKRKGDQDSRHLWPEMLRVIRNVQPKYVVGENVSGFVNWNGGMVFDEAQSDLENEGYEVQSFILPAVAVGAPHRRDRVWIVAHAKSWRGGRSGNGDCEKGSEGSNEPQPTISGTASANSDCFRCNGISSQDEIFTTKGRIYAQCNIKPFSKMEYAANSNLQRCKEPWIISESEREGQYSGMGNPRGAFDRFPTQSPICGGDDGISNRVDRLKALGNAIVPQVALQIFKAIQSLEDNS